MRIFILLCLASAVHSFRKPQRRSSDSKQLTLGGDQDVDTNGELQVPGGPQIAAGTEFPVPLGGCELGSAYGTRPCESFPFEPIPHCDNASFPAACWNSAARQAVAVYSRTVRTKSDYTNMLRTAMDFEGGGMGSKIGFGFSYMKKSRVTKDSVAFFRGMGGKTGIRQIQRVSQLKLQPAMKQVLFDNPIRFLQTFGLGYVHTITDGGSFLGSFTINTQDTSDTRDIEVYVNIEVRFKIFTVGGSQEFQRTTQTKRGRTQIYADVLVAGGTNLSFPSFQSPIDLDNLFKEWQLRWADNPKPLTVQTRKWIDSDDVLTILGNSPISDQDYELFLSTGVSKAQAELIGEECGKNKRMWTTTRMASRWLATQNDATISSCLAPLILKLDQKQIEIDLMSDLEALTVAIQFDAGNFSWRVADGFEGEFLACFGGADNVCKDRNAQLCPNHQSWERDDRYDWCFRNQTCYGEQSAPVSSAISATLKAFHEDGQDETQMRNELYRRWPGYEWMVIYARLEQNGWAWTLRGSLAGNSEPLDGDDDAFWALGVFCPTRPTCGICAAEQVCVQDTMKNVSRRRRRRVLETLERDFNNSKNCHSPQSLRQTYFAGEKLGMVQFANWGRPWGSRCSMMGLGGEGLAFAYTLQGGPADRSCAITVDTPSAASASLVVEEEEEGEPEEMIAREQHSVPEEDSEEDLEEDLKVESYQVESTLPTRSVVKKQSPAPAPGIESEPSDADPPAAWCDEFEESYINGR